MSIDAPAARAAGTRSDVAPLLGDLLCFDLYSMSRAMTAVYRPLLEPLGLTYPQFLVVVVLQRRGACTIREVGDVTRLDHGTLTPMLRRLATRGVIDLSRGADARTVMVSLSAAGEEMRPQVEAIHCRLQDQVGLSEAELVALQATLSKLAANLD